MLFVLSPAKTMRVQATTQYDIPIFEDKALSIIEQLKQLDDEALIKMMKLSVKQCDEVKVLYQNFGQVKTKTMDAYYGLVMKHAHLEQLNDTQLQYFQDHVRFLSAVYGILKGNDGISSYRLEAKSKLENKSMVEHWGNEIANICKDEFIVNLASKEYDQLLKPYIPQNQWLDIIFYVRKDGKLKTSATYAKMARGELLSYACQNQITDVKQLKQFNALDFSYDEVLSNEHCFVFVKEG